MNDEIRFGLRVPLVLVTAEARKIEGAGKMGEKTTEAYEVTFKAVMDPKDLGFLFSLAEGHKVFASFGDTEDRA